MAKKFQNLRKKMSPERRAKNAAATQAMLAEMSINELRRARHFSQEQLAELLNIKQGSVSKLERRTDLYISTLRRHIEAMGGHLELRANFPDGSVRISNFSDFDEDKITA